MGECGTMGDADAVVLADDRIPVAGGAYGSCYGGGGNCGDEADAGCICDIRGRIYGAAGDPGGENAERTVCGCGGYLLYRGADAGRQGVAGGDVAFFRSEFRQG